MNFACLLQSSLQLHTWRPAFPHYSSFTALLGTLACLFCTFYLDGLISLIVLVLALVLFLTIELRGDVTSFGHALKGLKYHVALSALYGLEESMTANAFLGAKSPFILRRKGSPGGGRPLPAGVRGEEGGAGAGAEQQPTALQKEQQHYWRPQILVYLHASESAPEAEVPRKRQLLSFVSQLKATRGLTVAGAVIVERNILEGMKQRKAAAAAVAAATGGVRSTTSLRRRFPPSSSSCSSGGGSDVSSIMQEQEQQQEQLQQQSLASLLGAEHEKTLRLKREMMSDLAREGILGFAEVVTAPDIRTGLSMLLQLTGLGGLRPNTCVIAWPDIAILTEERALRSLEFVARAAVHEKAIVALKMSNMSNTHLPFPTSTQVCAYMRLFMSCMCVRECKTLSPSLPPPSFPLPSSLILHLIESSLAPSLPPSLRSGHPARQPRRVLATTRRRDYDPPRLPAAAERYLAFDYSSYFYVCPERAGCPED